MCWLSRVLETTPEYYTQLHVCMYAWYDMYSINSTNGSGCRESSTRTVHLWWWRSRMLVPFSSQNAHCAGSRLIYCTIASAQSVFFLVQKQTTRKSCTLGQDRRCWLLLLLLLLGKKPPEIVRRPSQRVRFYTHAARVAAHLHAGFRVRIGRNNVKSYRSSMARDARLVAGSAACEACAV